MSPQHASLPPERWAQFCLDQQILMIANEMNRARKVLHSHEDGRLSNSYERILRLTDLTIQVQQRRSLRRELLRWRDLVAERYIATEPDRQARDDAFRCLLRFGPTASLRNPCVPGT